MNHMTLLAVTGRLRSTEMDFSTTVTLAVQNDTQASVAVFYLDTQGNYHFLVDVPGGSTGTVKSVYNKTYIVLRETYSNAFMTVAFVKSNGDPTIDIAIEVGNDDLLHSGDIGPIPTPNSSVVVPQDSTRVLVGCGVQPNGTVVRYQYWHLTSDSYCLPPLDTRTYSVTTSTGMQSTTSDSTTTSSAISASSSMGWGPISASISYALSASSTTSHSYTVSEQTTRFETITLGNPSKTEMVLYLAWQLMDVVEIYNSSTDVLTKAATVVSARPPLIYDGPWNPRDLPPPPDMGPALTEAQREALRAIPVRPRPAQPCAADRPE